MECLRKADRVTEQNAGLASYSKPAFTHKTQSRLQAEIAHASIAAMSLRTFICVTVRLFASQSQMLFSGAFFRGGPLCFHSFIGKSLSSLLQSPHALDGRLCCTLSSILYSPLHRSCLPLFSAFRCAKPPFTFSSTAQSCFSFLLCNHNGGTVVR